MKLNPERATPEQVASAGGFTLDLLVLDRLLAGGLSQPLTLGGTPHPSRFGSLLTLGVTPHFPRLIDPLGHPSPLTPHDRVKGDPWG